MNLDAKIRAAVLCLEREYGGAVDQPTLDYVIAEITREHRAERINQFKETFQSLIQGLRRRLAGLRPSASRA